MTVTEPWRPEELESIVQFIDERCGLHIRSDQLASTAKLIRRTMERLGCANIAELKTALTKDAAAMHALVNELTVGETYFFREPKHFQFLREFVIPETQQRLDGSRPMQIWSAACASGEEAYSVAMICDQLGYNQTTRIVATDISHAALSKAREGRYRDWSFRGDSLQQAAPYIQSHDDGLMVCEGIRSRVDFQYLNLATDHYQTVLGNRLPLDLILCRNVFIYFSRATITSVVEKMFECIVEGGWLLTASADPPLADLGAFEAVTTDLGIFYRKPGRSSTASLPSTPANAQPLPPLDTGLASSSEASAARGRQDQSDSDAKRNAASERPPPQSLPRRAESIPQAVAAARVAYANGDLERTIAVTEPIRNHLAACVLNLQAKARLNADEALRQLSSDLGQHSLSPELHYLHAVLLLDDDRIDEAYKSVQRAVFLDRSLAVPHFLLGSIQQKRGQLESAWRHYRNTRDLCAAFPADALIPLGEGSTASELWRAAQDRMNRIKPRGE